MKKTYMDEAKKLILNIVSWNHQRFLPRLFASLDAQDMRDFSVTVIDNASNDSTLEWVQSHRPEVMLLRNFRNQGFARGHNQGIELALSRWSGLPLEQRYVLVTNPDLEFAPDALRILVAYMDAHPEVAACGPKLLRAFPRGGDDGHEEVEHSTMLDSTGLVITKSRRVFDRGAGEEDRGQYDQSTRVFGYSGACFLVRASIVKDACAGGEFFDEDIFAYKEDVDVCWRMRRLGMEIHYVPHAVAWHHRRAPSIPTGGWLAAWRLRQKKSPFINYLSSRNHRWVLMKNDEWGNALLHAPWWVPYEVAKLCACFISWSTMKGVVASFLGWSKMRRKRKELAARVTQRGASIRSWFV